MLTEQKGKPPMADTTPRAQALYRKAMSGPLEAEEKLRLAIALFEDGASEWEADYDDVVGVLDTLDASRAETEAVRAERDRTSNNRDMWRGQCERQATDLVAARSLVAELVEGLEKCLGNIGGPIEAEIAALISKVRAAGIPPAPEGCDCIECVTAMRVRGRRHASDCAVHNAPAYDVGPCTCGAMPAPEGEKGEG